MSCPRLCIGVYLKYIRRIDMVRRIGLTSFNIEVALFEILKTSLDHHLVIA